MAVDVEITGNGTFAGARSAVGSYSVQEDSTPVEASDSSGGIGQISFTATDDTSRFGSLLLLNDEVTLEDGDRGLVRGKINSLTGNDGILNVTADSLLGRLVGTRRAGWVDGTLEEVLTYYFSLAGVTGGFGIDDSIADLPVTAIGWEADVWTKVKELLVVYGAEISVVRGQIVVRPVRTRRALELNNSSINWNASNTDMAEKVEVAYYSTEVREGEMIYPYGGWNEDTDIYTVDAGETKTINIPVDGWISHLVQPTVQDYVSPTATESVYAVAGNDGFPITAAQWKATGGALSVAIGEDGQSIDLTLVGATGASEKYAPYRIAVSAGSGNYYSSLRIHGTAALYNRRTVVVYTGAGDAADSDLGATVDNIYIRTEEQARNVAADVAGKYSSPVRTISINKADINKPGSSESSYNYVTFAEFDEYLDYHNIETFEDFDEFYEGQTFGELDQYWYEQVEDSFDFQVFGNANGARVQWRRNMYRIRSVTTTESNVSYTAEADTTFADFDALAGDSTTELVKNLYTQPSFELAQGTKEVRRNLARNPKLAATTTDWGGAGSDWTNVGRVAIDSHPLGFEWGFQRNKAESGTATAGGLYYNIRNVPAVGPRVYSVWVRSVEGEASFRPRVERYSTPTGGSNGGSISGLVVTVGPEWQRVSIEVPYDAELTRHVFTLYTASNIANAVKVQLTGALIETSDATEPGTYFDGDVSPDPDLVPSWTGTPNNSQPILSAQTVADNAGWRSGKWSASGDYSMYVPELNDVAGEPLAKLDGPVTASVTAPVTLGAYEDSVLYAAYKVDENNSSYFQVGVLRGSAINDGRLVLQTAVNALGSRVDFRNGSSNHNPSGSTGAGQRTPGTVALGWVMTANNMANMAGGWNSAVGNTQTPSDRGEGMATSGRLTLPSRNASGAALTVIGYRGSHDVDTRAAVLGWLKTRYQFVNLNNQTFMITPRNSGQIVYFGGNEIVTTAGVPVRVTGTGPVGLSSGWWDEAGLFAGEYGGEWFDGNTTDNNYGYVWDGIENNSPSTKYEGHPALTFEEFDRLFDGKTFSDFALAPLVNVNPEYDRE